MNSTLFPILSVLLFGCNSNSTQSNNYTSDTIQIKKGNHQDKNINQKESDGNFTTHLKDTVKIKGNYVLFLRPDSARFESYADIDEHIYDADSDFGLGISNTMDSMLRDKLYKQIKAAVSESRYILVYDCENCPRILDRDTINYGLILAAKRKPIKIITNLHSGDYLTDIDKYFSLQ